jgi:YD repeat-containing protein
MKTSIRLILILLILPFVVFSQTINPPTDIKSPNTANLGHYGDVPVNLYNGTTNVNVPLYSFNEGGVPLDVSLSYDSSGVRVNSTASWVGQNWSLNAGGVITRSIRGEKDLKFRQLYRPERNITYFQQGFKNVGWRLNTTDWATTSNLANLVNESDAWTRSNDYYDMDLEPDIFTFNFMGISGKFFLGNDGEWKVQSDQKLKIEVVERLTPTFSTSTLNTDVFDVGQIMITDLKGIKYLFGKIDDHIEYTNPLQNYVSQPWGYSYKEADEIPNAWYLSSVEDHNNVLLYEFEYERGSPITHFYRVNNYSKGGCMSANNDGTYSYFGVITEFTGEHCNGSVILPIYLKQIQSGSGKTIVFNSSELDVVPYSVDKHPLKGAVRSQFHEFFLSPPRDHFHAVANFTSSDFNTRAEFFQARMELFMSQLKWRKLDEIKILDKNDLNILNLNLNYFSIGENGRLNLQSVDNIGRNSQELNLYSFEYNSFDELPHPLSKQFDKWGFFNNIDYSVPTVVSRQFDYYNPIPDDYFAGHEYSRRSSDYGATRGMLKKINYPTGGFTFFIYEANKASQKVNAMKQLEPFDINTTIGGVRIKNIIKSSNHSVNEWITYNYEGGILMYDPVFFHPNWPSSGNFGDSYVFDINSLVPLSNINGGHIGYSKVTETYGDNSKSIYRFTDYNLYPDIAYEATLSAEQSVFNKSTDRSLLRGKLLGNEKYNSNNILKQSTDLTYLNVDLQPYSDKYVRAFEYKKPGSCSTYGETFGNAYKLYYMNYDVVRRSTTTYFDNNTSIVERSDYDYNEDHLISETTTTKSDGNVVTQKTKYPRDYAVETSTVLIPGVSPPIIYKNVYRVMYERNMLNYPIEVTQTSNNKTLGSTLNSYIRSSNGNTVSINPFKSSSLKKQSTLDANFVPAVGTSSYLDLIIDPKMEDQIIYDKFDEKGNILMYHLVDGTNTVFVWGYNKTKVIAKIDNVTDYNSISNYIYNLQTLSDLDDDRTLNNAGNEGALRQALNNLRSLTSLGLSESFITTYTYDPLIGITSITDPRGRTMYYEYDDFNRLKWVKDHEGNILSENEYKYATQN